MDTDPTSSSNHWDRPFNPFNATVPLSKSSLRCSALERPGGEQRVCRQHWMDPGWECEWCFPCDWGNTIGDADVPHCSTVSYQVASGIKAWLWHSRMAIHKFFVVGTSILKHVRMSALQARTNAVLAHTSMRLAPGFSDFWKGMWRHVRKLRFFKFWGV